MELVNNAKLKISEFFRNSANLNSKISQEISDIGFSIVENFLTEDECETLEERSNLLFSTDNLNIKVASNGFDKRFFGIEFFDKHFKLRKLETISFNSFSELVNIKEYGYTYMLNKITAGDGNLGSGDGWHRDSPISPQYKAILYLTDVTESNGPFQYLPKSNSVENIIEIANILGSKLSDYRYTDDNIDKLLGNGFEIKTFKAKKGTLILADTRGIHRGKTIEENYRIALTRYNFYRKPSKSLGLAKINLGKGIFK